MFQIVSRLLNKQRSTTAAVTPENIRDMIQRKNHVGAIASVKRWRAENPTGEAQALCLEGELAFHQRRDHDAENAFRAALSIDAGLADAHYGLSLILCEQNRVNLATEHAQFASNCAPLEARFHAQVGFCHLQLGNVMAADQPLRVATRLDPGNAYAWNNRGLIHRIKGELLPAGECFATALRIDPGFAHAAEHLSNIEADLAATHHDAGEQQLDNQERIQAAEMSLIADPDNEALACELAHEYEAAGDMPSALSVIQVMQFRHPGSKLASLELGLLMAKMHSWNSAITELQASVHAFPDRIDGLLALARCLSAKELHSAAQPHLERAHQLAPDDQLVQGSLAAGYTNLCRYEEALAICDELESRGALPHCKGLALMFSGQIQAAIFWLTKMLDSHPNDPSLHMQRAQFFLSQLQFEKGWDDYAYRRLSDSKDLRVLPFPLWGGESLEDKRILILTEQGLGDQVMFASCLSDLLALRPAQVTVEASARIAKTIQRSFPDCIVVPTQQSNQLDWVSGCGIVDYYISLGDLPRHFRRSLTQFPDHSGYLRADPLRIEHWAKNAGKREKRPRIGVSWRGGTEGTRTFVRSIPPASFAKLATGIDATWISLQYGDVSAELPTLQHAGMIALHAPEAITDLDEFAALIAGLDLIITVCNTTVHYAGALGKPVWILSPTHPEWRYGLTNEQLPWYPSSKMFRQSTAGDWDAVIRRANAELSDTQSLTDCVRQS